ncbi:hypothetical protein [Yoonia algicola]|uniref:Uncharacterized protein n=1 Tax=Yoonia algicola TaxID=3137368 RepID=A0AAN0NID4_9RHOB
MAVKPDPVFTKLTKVLSALKETASEDKSAEAAARELKEDFKRENGGAPLTDGQRQAVRRTKIRAERETKRKKHVRRCVACGAQLPVSARADTKTCSDACRQKVSRNR